MTAGSSKSSRIGALLRRLRAGRGASAAGPRRPLIDDLEPRLLFSADVLPVAPEVLTPPPDAPVAVLEVDAATPPLAADRVSSTSLPLAFEENAGQSDEQVDFLARGNGYTVFLGDGDAFINLRGDEGGHVVRLALQGAAEDPAATGSDDLGSASRYFVDGEPEAREAEHFAAVAYADVYDGIDLLYYGNQRQLEYDFSVGPGADPGAIRIAFEGAQSVHVGEGGELVVTLNEAGQAIRFQAPVSFQDGPEGREAVESRYRLHDDGSVGFELGSYDAGRTLVIDPILDYSTYLGGTGSDVIDDVVVDELGQAYLVGETFSTDFPATPGAYQAGDLGGIDAFVAKLDPSGSRLLWASYLGGSGTDRAQGVARDSAGNLYVAGTTYSSDFPTTPGADDTTHNTSGDGDVFVTKLSGDGSSLLWGTFVGGEGRDTAAAIDVDGSGNVYITGFTDAGDFPTTLGAFDTSYAGSNEAFVTKLAASGSSLVYSTFLGTASSDIATGIVVDAAGQAHVVGHTNGPGFALSANAYDTTHSGGQDAFVTKLNAAGDNVLYSSYFGGSNTDWGNALDIDSLGNIYVAGQTIGGATNLPTTPGAYDTTLNGGADAFLAIFDPSAPIAANTLTYSTYYGGSAADTPYGVAYDEAFGVVWVTTRTASTNLPTTADAHDTTRGATSSWDAAFFAIDPNSLGSADLFYSSYLGGGADLSEKPNAIAVDPDGNVYVVGETSSSDFETTAGAHDTSLGGSTDGFVTRFSAPTAQLWVSPEDDVPAPSGWKGMEGLEIRGGDVVAFGSNATYGPGTTDGSFSPITSFNDRVQAGNGRINAMHQVGRDMLVGTNLVSLEAGDLLFSPFFGETYVSSDTSTLFVDQMDIAIFRPDTPGDYSSGMFSILVDGSDIGLSTVLGFTLVEQDTVVGTGGGATSLSAGDFLLVDWLGDSNPVSNHIQRYQPTTLGTSTGGGRSVLVDVNDLKATGPGGSPPTLVGVELVESPVRVGDTVLRSGQILTKFTGPDTVVGVPVTEHDILALDVTTTGTSSVATASLLFDGSDVGLNVWQEDLRGITLATGLPPTALDDAYDVAEDTPFDSDADTWHAAGWGARQRLSFDNSAQTQDLDDFPVLISLDATNIDYAKTQNGGEDLRFFDADGTPLAYEIDHWDETGTSTVWVRVPRIDGSSTGDSIWMYYDGGVTPGETPSGVWASDYRTVYHLSEDPTLTAGVVAESTSNPFDGINQGSVDVAGAVGNAQDFDGSNDFIDLVGGSFVDGASYITISAWFNPDIVTSNQELISISVAAPPTTTISRVGIERAGDEIEVFGRSADGESEQLVGTTALNLTPGVWHHVTGVIDYAADSILIYIDGALHATTGTPSFSNPTADALPSANAAIGAQDDGSFDNFDGKLDEIRVEVTDRSADWIRAQHLSMTDAFVSLSREQTAAGVLENDSDPEMDLLSAVALDTVGTLGNVILNGDGTFTYDPAGNFESLPDGGTTTDSFRYTASDGNGGYDTATVNLTVHGANDAPTLGNGVLTAVDEDTVSPPGATITSLLGAGFGDVDAGSSFAGIAVTGNTANPLTQGAWQYSSDAGANWFAVGTVADGPTALAVQASSLLRFVPVANYSGAPPDLVLRGLDDTYAGAWSTTSAGETRITADTTTPGGTTPIAAATSTLSTSINAVNDAPTLGNGALAAVNEDTTSPPGATITSLLGGGFADVDGSFAGIAVTGNTANPLTQGAWQYSSDAGANWFGVGTVADGASALAVQQSSLLRFLPVPEYSGAPPDLVLRGIDDSYPGPWSTTTGGTETRVTLDTSTPGDPSAIAAATSSLSTSITAVNDPPVVANIGTDTLLYNAGAGSLRIDQGSDGLVTDVDSANFAGGRFEARVSSGGVPAEDVLGIRDDGIGPGAIGVSGSTVTYGGVPIGTFTGGTGGVDLVVNLNAAANPGNVTALVKNITYENLDTLSPTIAVRDVQFWVFDGDGGAGVATAFVNVANTPPTIAGALAGQTTNDKSTRDPFTAVTIGDADVPAQTLTVEVSLDVAAKGTLSGGGFTDLGGGVYRFTGNAGAATTAIRALTFDPTENRVPAGSTETTTFTISVDDATATPVLNSVTTVITTSVNDPPTFSDLAGDVLAYTEGDGAVVIDQAVPAVVLDLDSPDLDGGFFVVSIPVGKVASEDVLWIRNEGIGAGQIGESGGSVTYGGLGIGTAVGGAGGSDLVIALNTNATPAAVTALARNITYENVDTDSPTPASRTVRFRTSDGDGGLSSDFDTTINVSAENDAPTLGNGTLTSVPEDTTSPAGALISSLLGGTFADVDAGSSFAGIAVTGNPANPLTQGSWQYSSDAGANWYAVGTVADGPTALAIQASSLLRFVPVANYNGAPPDLVLRGLDDSYAGAWSTTSAGETRITVDTATPGGTTPIAAAPSSLSTSISAVNDAPTLGNGTLAAVNEDAPNPPGATITSLFGGGFGDVDSGSSFSGIAIVGNAAPAAQGVWEYSSDAGANWFAVGSVTDGATALAVQATSLLRFDPAPDYNGTPTDLVLRGLDDVYGGPWSTTTGGTETRQTLDTSSPGTPTPIAAATRTLSTSITAFNDPPDVSNVNFDTLSYGPGAGALRIEQGGDALVTDVDSANFDLGRVEARVALGGVPAEDVLGIRDDGSGPGAIGVSGSTVTYGGVPIGTFTGGTGGVDLVVTLNAAANPTNAAELLKNITYENTDAVSPTLGTRNVELWVFDGDGGGTSSTTFVNVNNTAPTVVGTLAGQTTNDKSTRDPFTGVTIGDTDVPAQTLTVEVSLDVAAKGTLSGGGFTDLGGGVYRFTGNAGAATTAIRALTFDPTENRVPAGSTETTTFTIRVDDAIATPVLNSVTTVITTSVNDPPTVSDLAGDVLAYTEDDGAVVIDQAVPAGIADLDSPNFGGGSFVVSIPLGNVAGEDVLWIRNEGIGAGQIGESGGSVTYGGLGIGTASGGSGGTNLVISLNGNATPAAVTALARNITYENSDTGAPTVGARTVRFQVDDGDGGLSASYDTTVNVTDRNDAPTLGNGTLAGVPEDTASPAGASIASLFGGVFADPDGSFSGIAVTGNTANPVTQGAWQYSSDAGASWFAVGSVTDGATALAIQTSSLLRFLPVTDYNGAPPDLVLRGLDDTYAGPWSTTTGGTETRQTLDTSSPGATTPIAAATSTLSTSISAVNDAPTLGNGVLAAVNEDTASPPGATITSLFGAGFADVDAGSSLAGVALVGNTANPVTQGAWQYSSDAGANWFAVGSVADGASALAVQTSSLLRFLPVADYDGVPPDLVLRALDNSYGGAWATTTGGTETRITVDTSIPGTTTPIAAATSNLSTSITPVNDAPTLGNGTLAAVPEDTVSPPGATITSLFGGVFSDVDGTFAGIAVVGNSANPVTQGTWQYSSDAGASWFAVGSVTDGATALAIQQGSLLRFVPVPDYAGAPPDLVLRGLDDSYGGAWSTTTGGTETRITVNTSTPGDPSPIAAATSTLATAINAVNDAPTIGGTLPGQLTDDKTPLSPFGSVVIGDVDLPGDVLTVDVTLDDPAKGVLLGGFTPTGPGAYRFTGSAAAATAAIQGLSFDPAENRVSVGSTETTGFTISVADGTAPAVLNGTTTVISTSINDAPTAGSASFTVPEGAPFGTVLGLVAGSDPDPGDVLSWSIVAGNVAGAFAIDAAGTISVANPAAIDLVSNPTFNLTVQVMDAALAPDTANVSVTVDPMVVVPPIGPPPIVPPPGVVPPPVPDPTPIEVEPPPDPAPQPIPGDLEPPLVDAPGSVTVAILEEPVRSEEAAARRDRPHRPRLEIEPEPVRRLPESPLVLDDAMLRALDLMNLEMDRSGEDGEAYLRWIGSAAELGTIGMVAGFLTWFLRGGALLPSLLSVLPMWTRMDPLPVLAISDAERRALAAADAEDEDEEEKRAASVLDARDPSQGR